VSVCGWAGGDVCGPVVWFSQLERLMTHLNNTAAQSTAGVDQVCLYVCLSVVSCVCVCVCERVCVLLVYSCQHQHHHHQLSVQCVVLACLWSDDARVYWICVVRLLVPINSWSIQMLAAKVVVVLSPGC